MRPFKNILQIFNVSTFNRVVLEVPFENYFKGYADCELYQPAILASLEAIITRNKNYYVKSSLPVYSPNGLIDALDVLE